MSLAQLQLPPPTAAGYVEWSFYHWQHHKAIISAVKSVLKVQLTEYAIFPLDIENPNTLRVWLENHQQMHTDVDPLFKIIGNDLSTVNFRDQRQREAFFWLNFNEHRSIGAACGVTI